MSAAFAEAESSGKFFNIAPVKVDTDEGLDDEMAGDGEQDIFGRGAVKGKEDSCDSGEEELPIKKMASMSLAARVKMKLGAKSAAAPAVRRRFSFSADTIFFNVFPSSIHVILRSYTAGSYGCSYECFG